MESFKAAGQHIRLQPPKSEGASPMEIPAKVESDLDRREVNKRQQVGEQPFEKGDRCNGVATSKVSVCECDEAGSDILGLDVILRSSCRFCDQGVRKWSYVDGAGPSQPVEVVYKFRVVDDQCERRRLISSNCRSPVCCDVFKEEACVDKDLHLCLPGLANS